VTEPGRSAGHAFLSYVPADSGAADALREALEAAGVRTWRADAEVLPGDDWRDRARAAISGDAFAFLACFSRSRLALGPSAQHEELVWAIDELRRHPPGVPWLIPVRFDDCEIPDIGIGAGQTLGTLRPADLFGPQRAAELARLVTAVTRILEPGRARPARPGRAASAAPPRLGRAAHGTALDDVLPGSVMLAPVLRADIGSIAGPLPMVTVPAQLRPAVRRFAGRARQLDEVAEFLDPAAADGPPLCVISGLPGVGKTELARQACEKASAMGWFTGGVIDIDMHGYDDAPLTAEQALDAALQALGVPAESIPAAAEQRAALYRSEMAARGPVLVVADSAADPRQVRVLVAAGTRHRVLVTSRETMAEPGARLIELPVLTDAEAVELLYTAVRQARPGDGRIASDRQATAQVAERCGYLPLALQIAAALLKRDPGKPVAELASELADETRRLARLSFEDRAVLSVFDLSYRRLDPAEGRLFRLLSVNPGPDLATEAAAALAGAPANDVRLMLDGLADAHIVERLAVRDRWRMHDLVRAYARQRGEESAAADDRDAARYRVLEHYRAVADEAFGSLTGGEDARSGQRFADRAAAVTWLESERLNLVAATTGALTAGLEAISLDLALSLVPYLIARLHLDDLRIVADAGIMAARGLGQPAEEAEMVLAQGYLLRIARQFDEAEAAGRQAIAISQESGNRISECQALTFLGATLAEAGRFEEAMETCGQAGEIARAVGSGTGEGLALSNQALALVQLNRHADAVPLCRKAAELARASGSLDGAWVALNNLMMALLKLDQPAEAVTAGNDALAVAEESGNLDHQAFSLSNLAEALTMTGQAGQALEAAQRAAELWQATPSRHREAMALLGLAGTMEILGLHAEALQASRRAADIFSDLADARMAARSLRIAGSSLGGLRLPDEAAAVLGDAVAEARSADDDFAAGLILDDLGDIHFERQRFRTAAVAYLQASSLLSVTGAARAADRAYDRMTAALKKLRHWTAREILDGTDGYPPDRLAMVDLGYALAGTGRPADAAALHQQAVDLSRVAADPRAEALALTALGDSLCDLNRPGEAVESCRLAIGAAGAAGLRREEAVAWGGLARALEDAGRTDEAVAAWRSAVAIRQEIGNPYSLAGALTRLGMALCDLAAEEAVTVLRQAVDLYAGMGRDTAATAKTALAACLNSTGRPAEAVPLARDAFLAFRDSGDFRRAYLASGIWWRARYLRRRGRSARPEAARAPAVMPPGSHRSRDDPEDEPGLPADRAG